MVTVELAIGAIITVLLTGCLVSVSMLGVAQATCAEASAQLARQSARGDARAVAAARQRVPDGARVNIIREPSGVSAEVRMNVTVLGLGQTVVGARAWAAYEPGESQ